MTKKESGMLTSAVALYHEKIKGKIDWKLLAFLLLFLNVKLVVKIPVILFFTLWSADFKFGFRWKSSRLPLFYPLIMIIAVINWIITLSFHQINYNILFFGGLFFWLLCILAIHQIKLAVESNKPAITHHTITLFFIINAAISFGVLLLIALKIHSINPYTYQGHYQKYFINTGDYIKGITFDNSITNAILNAFGVVYFLTRKNAVMLLVCMAVMLLTGSNFVNVILMPVLLALFIFRTDRLQKSLIVICIMFLVVFMGRISPQNNKYTTQTIAHFFEKPKGDADSISMPQQVILPPLTLRPNSELNVEERKQKVATLYLDSVGKILDSIRAHERLKLSKDVFMTYGGRISIREDDINGGYFQSKDETPAEQIQLVQFIQTYKDSLPISGNKNYTASLPGKAIGFLQSVRFLKNHMNKLATGIGLGRFSSKIAYRASGLSFAGGYPAKFIFIDHNFLVNHLDLYLNFFSKRSGFHSLTHSPFSVYDQLLTEYGVIGLACFIIFYVAFFTKHYKKLTYGLPILLLTLAILVTDYWFEQLSVLVFFELLMLLNIKENQTVNPIAL